MQWGGNSFTYDPNGNLASDALTSYAWSARNQLSGLSGIVTASFAYDGNGRRRGKTISGATTNFLCDGLNLVQELASGGTPTANLLTGLGSTRRSCGPMWPARACSWSTRWERLGADRHVWSRADAIHI
jgi:hypothetical protein